MGRPPAPRPQLRRDSLCGAHVTPFLILLLLIGIGILAQVMVERHSISRSVSVLARLQCPQCASTYGSEAAHAARDRPVPPPKPRAGIIDIAPAWIVHCARCGTDSCFVPEIGLVGPLGDVERTEPAPPN
jgi:hypothetical protein